MQVCGAAGLQALGAKGKPKNRYFTLQIRSGVAGKLLNETCDYP